MDSPESANPISEFEQQKYKLPFPCAEGSKEFMDALFQALLKEIERQREEQVPTENMLAFYHGRTWTYPQEREEGIVSQRGELERQSTSCRIGIDRVFNCDNTVVPDFIRETADKFGAAMRSRLYSELIAVTEETGNVLHIPKEGSLADAMLEMIRKTTLVVGPDNTISRPTLHLNPATFARFQNELPVADEARQQEVAALWEQKEAEARQRETARLARYHSTE